MRMNVDGTKQVRQHLTEAGQENSNFVNNPFDVSVLSMEVDSNALFRRDALPLIPGRKKEGLDEVLVALLSEANQELAHLLRDVRTESQGVLLGGHQIRPVNELLMRAVRCAAQQYMLQAELGNLALTDELTGLYNRRGFMALAERQLKVGRRSGREMLLFFIDLDGLKQINDSFGHSEGDRALKRTAQALEMAFRGSDVIARVAGDEFAILAIEAAGHSEATIRNRLCGDLKSISAEESRYTISLSLGAARFDPRSGTSLGELMVQADRAMYEVKRGRSKPSAILENGHRTR
jgi:diguanylate cyclase (GGDEF)-like protein